MTKTLSILLIILFAFGTISFIPAKYTKSFKKQKKSIDTLIIYTPIIRMIADNNKTVNIDSSLSQSNQELLSVVTSDLLSKKYTLNTKHLSSFNFDFYKNVSQKLIDSPKTISDISFDSVLSKQDMDCNSRFALLFVMQGTINPDFPPHYNLTSGMASNTIVIAPYRKPHIDLQLLIIDTELNQIVFFDRINTTNSDPRISSEMEHITKTILRKIYYK